MRKKAILVVSSGTSNEKARKENIETVERRIADTFSSYEVRRAFTSQKILNRLKLQGIHIDNPLEAMQRLKIEGFEEIVIQPLQIIPGMEYEKILKVTEKFNSSFELISVGRPLLYKDGDFSAAVAALKAHLPEMDFQQAYALMGHGSSHTAQEYYSVLQRYIDEAGIKAYVGTIKGKPGIQQVIERLRKDNIKEVTLVPFMLVAGNHAIADMASDEEDSWKSILLKEGFKVSIYLKGLGENTEYQQIYVNKVKNAIEISNSNH